jgi:hypothetical protein
MVGQRAMGDDFGMEPFDQIDRCVSDIRDSSWAFNEAAGRKGSAAAAALALITLEEAFLALSSGWYEIRDDSARAQPDDHRDSRIARLDDIAAELAGCARRCRETRLALMAIDPPEERTPSEPQPQLVAL